MATSPVPPGNVAEPIRQGNVAEPIIEKGIVTERIQPITGELTGNQNAIFTFTLNSFAITETRSLHKDTDFVSISVAVGSNPPVTVPTKSMGDLNNGVYQVNLSIPDVE